LGSQAKLHVRWTIEAHPGGGIGYLHSYHSSRPRVDWNRCGQAAVATLLDYHGLDPYGLNKPVYDENDGRRHWADGEIIDRIGDDLPPDHLFGLFGTTPGRLKRALRFAGLDARWVASTNKGERRQRIWEAIKTSVEADLPVIVAMDMGRLGGRPLSAHWGVVYRIEDSNVHLANTKNVTMAPEARFLRVFECWFMSPRFHHCAVFARPKTDGSPRHGRTGAHAHEDLESRAWRERV
jgi:hypothetical protein